MSVSDEFLWPNQTPVVEGVVPVADIPQDQTFFDDDEDDPELEMET
jgi:hypothetical protein